MRFLGFLIASLVTLSIAAVPAAARVVRMQTTVALSDRSEPSVDTALRQALDMSARGVMAMGLSSMWVADARVLSDSVVISVVATDEVEVLDDSEEERDGRDAEPSPVPSAHGPTL